MSLSRRGLQLAGRAQTARAIEHGAAAALDKIAQLDQVVDAVRRVRAGQTLLATDEIVELLRFAGRRREQERTDREAIETLTPREREVLHALGAARADSQLQAVLFALRYGIIDEH